MGDVGGIHMQQLLQQKMQAHPRLLTRKDRFKTIITSDTYDVNPTESTFNQENKPRNGSFMRTQHSHKKNKNKDSLIKKQHKSISSMYGQSRAKEGSPKSKVKRMLSIHPRQDGRLATDYSQTVHPFTFKRMVSELKKKIVYPIKDQYRLQAFKILRKVLQTPTQQFYTAKMGVGAGKEKKYTLICLKEGKAKDYQAEKKAYSQVCRDLGKKQKTLFLKIHHIWKEKKHWMAAIDSYLSPRHFDDDFYLFLNLFKNSDHLITLFIQQIATAIHFLSKTERAHGHLTLSSIFFPVFKGMLKAEGQIKIGALSKCISLKNKEEVLQLPIRYHTPPEVLNFILFEEGESFDREYLEQISQLTEGWQIDVWSLGIMVLQLLNGGPLSGEGSDCSRLIGLQRQLLIRYSYLFERLSHQTQRCLSSMLSLNPQDRPHPIDILQILGEANGFP